MSIYGYGFYICALFAVVMSLQVNLDSDVKGLDKLQRANEFAVHDAAIPLSLSNVSEGRFVFDQVQGRQNYIESLGYSLDSIWNGTEFIPTENSFFQAPIKLLYLEFVDSSNPSCSTFPCEYNVPIVNSTESLSGPSVIAIVESESPRYFRGDPTPLRKYTIYEYK